MDFMLGLPKTVKKHNYVFIIVDRLSKIVYFLPCNKASDTSKIAQIYFDGVVNLHGLLKTIMSDRDVKFLLFFGISMV